MFKFRNIHVLEVSCLLVFLMLPVQNAADFTSGASQDICISKQNPDTCSSSSSSSSSYIEERNKEGVEDVGNTESDSLLHRSMQELEAVLDKMVSSKDQMMNDLTDKLSDSRIKLMEALDSMMDRMSESRTNMMEGMDAMLQKMVKSKEKMVEGLDTVLDGVTHSRMVEEIDQLIESVSRSKVVQELSSIPQELRHSFILSARNRSYIAAGIMVAIAAAILFGGAIYYAWCHHDAWSYYIGTIEEAKALLRQAKEASFIGRSRSASEDLSSHNTETSSISSQDARDSGASMSGDGDDASGKGVGITGNGAVTTGNGDVASGNGVNDTGAKSGKVSSLPKSKEPLSEARQESEEKEENRLERLASSKSKAECSGNREEGMCAENQLDVSEDDSGDVFEETKKVV